MTMGKRPLIRGTAVRAVALASAALTLGVPRTSAADATPSLGLELSPAGDRAFAVERAAVRGHKLVSTRVGVDYAREPLVLVNGAQVTDVVVEDQTSLHLLASFSLLHRLALNVDLPFTYVQAGALPASGGTALRAAGGEIGDLRLGARVKLLQSTEDPDEGTVLALASSIWLPTATDGYAGDGAVRARLALVAEGSGKRLYWGFNGGARTRPSSLLAGILPTRVGTSIVFGIGGGFFLDGKRDIALGAEAIADFTVGGGARLFDPRATTAQLLLTSHYRLAGGPFEIGAAFGPALGQASGSADFRAIVLMGYAPESAAPPPDRDEDGVPDKSDACISLRGVESVDPLLHGCPLAPPDGDGDAIPDGFDACPKLAGEATGIRATHGCPKPKDTDGDGVLDEDDECPDEPGVPPPEGRGCPAPKEPPPAAALVASAIVISQQVQFETATAVLRPESDGVLVSVARVLGEHPEVELVEVQGHTDDMGFPEVNRRLGQDRAESVVAWLVSHGITRSRLAPKGYGSDDPIASNSTEEGRMQNRRVEFRVLRTKKAPEPTGAPEGGVK